MMVRVSSLKFLYCLVGLLVFSLKSVEEAMPLSNALSNALSQDSVLFVSDRDEKANWDIYSMNPDGTGIQRLTTSPSIENHPGLSPDGTEVIFSSNLTGNFEIYIAPLSTIGNAATWQRLTSYGCDTGTVECTPARHPEWSPNGSHQIIYTAKDGCRETTKAVVSQCSVPIVIKDPCGEKFERIHIINSDGTKDRVIDVQGLDSRIVHAGHPAFSPDSSKIVFTGAINPNATEWEVFVVDWDGSPPSNLRQVTSGSLYPPSPNPIQMTGAARFNPDGSKIYFTSTRIGTGKSQLFAVPADAQNVPVSDDIRMTYNCANDYMPDFVDSLVVYTSDSNIAGPTWDLDIFSINSDGSGRRNLTDNDSASEKLLIADEVSWFCGLPPNLSDCNFTPRAVTIESFAYMVFSDAWLPRDFPNKEKYPVYMEILTEYMHQHYPEYDQLIALWLADYLENPKDVNTAMRLIVIPSLMPPIDLCSDCVEIITTSLPGAKVGRDYSYTLEASKVGVNWKIFAGSLPSGLLLNTSTGEISGIPSEGGKFTFSVAAIEANGNADSKNFTIKVFPQRRRKI